MQEYFYSAVLVLLLYSLHHCCNHNGMNRKFILMHLIWSDWFSCVHQQCSSTQNKLMPRAPMIMLHCPPIKNVQSLFLFMIQKHCKHASADSCAFLSQLRCTLTFSSVKTLLGPQISAPQQAWLLMGRAWVGSCACATYDKPHYCLASRQA